MTNLIGKRFRTLVEDRENDDDYGEVVHPIGSTFVVGEFDESNGCYDVQWERAVDKNGNDVPATGMWTLWTAEEIQRDAEEEHGTKPE